VYNSKEKRLKPRHIFLFNDCLLIAKREGRQKYWLKVFISLGANIQIEDVQDSASNEKVEFRIYAAKKNFILFARSRPEKESWLSELKDLIAKRRGEKEDEPVSFSTPEKSPVDPYTVKTKSVEDDIVVVPSMTTNEVKAQQTTHNQDRATVVSPTMQQQPAADPRMSMQQQMAFEQQRASMMNPQMQPQMMDPRMSMMQQQMAFEQQRASMMMNPQMQPPIMIGTPVTPADGSNPTPFAFSQPLPVPPPSDQPNRMSVLQPEVFNQQFQPQMDPRASMYNQPNLTPEQLMQMQQMY